ncbi:hypothetical protein [Mucilaginibacter sp.]|uniref:hypothetical protein n=1 Tax=Mucilaginibacter sp. TaxID=1882438 RepID=UPI003D0C6C1A
MKQSKILLILLISILLVPAIIISSCKKDNTKSIKNGIEATVLNQGSPAADGCGWVIKINSTDSVYSPINLPVNYQTDNLKVLISYKSLNTKFQCGLLPTAGYYQIQLITIQND